MGFSMEDYSNIYFGYIIVWKIIRIHTPDVILSFGEVPIFLSAFVKFISGKVNYKLIQNVRNHESTFLKNCSNGNLKKYVLGWSLNQGSYLTGNSNEIVREIKDVLDCSVPVCLIYNPINLDRFNNFYNKRTSCKPFPQIINIARLDKQKGQSYLLDSFSTIQKKYPDAELTFVGEGEYEVILRNQVERLGLTNINFLGWRSDIPLLLQNNDIFCLTSLWEGMPNVLLEAMAAGIPIVSFDCQSGPREILGDGKYGLLVPVGNSEKLTEAIFSLLENEELGKYFSKKGLEQIKKYKTSTIINKWVYIINR